MGYHFLITKNGNQIYSNISEEEMRAAESVAGTAMESAKTLTASYHDVSVVKHTFYHGEKAVCILAVHTGETDPGSYLLSAELYPELYCGLLSAHFWS